MDGPWAIAGAIAAIILLGITVWQAILVPWQRRRALSNPCHVHFLLTSKEKYSLEYVEQDQLEHFVDTLVLPANRENIFIEITIRAKTDFTIKRIIFGAAGVDYLHSKPYAMRYYQRHIRSGIAANANPMYDKDHTVDSNYHYQMKTDIHLKPKRAHNPGFYLKTRDPGVYKMELFLTGDDFEYRTSLTIRVEQNPDADIPCVREIDSEEHQTCKRRFHFGATQS